MPYKDTEKRKEYAREYNREYMKKHRLDNNAMYKERETARREANPAQRLVYCTKQSSKIKGLEHTIDISDLPLPEFCPLLGIKIDYSAGNGKTMFKPSVDRIDPTKGYIKGNVEVMSSLANTMKSKATPEQLVYFAKKLLERYDTNV